MLTREVFKQKLLWPTIITIICFITLIFLGSWQTIRLNWKTELIDSFSKNIKKPAIELSEFEKSNDLSIEFVKVKSIGYFDNQASVAVIGRSPSGTMGYRHLIPFSKNKNSKARDADKFKEESIWVDKGFLDKDYESFPRYDGHTKLEGLVRFEKKPSFFIPDNDAQKNIWYYVNLDDLSNTLDKASNTDYYLTITSNVYDFDEDKVLFTFPNNHLQYLIIWFSLAVWIIFVYIYYFRSVIKQVNNKTVKSSRSKKK